MEGTRGLSCTRTVPAMETGDERPDGEGESERICVCASNSPVALALEEPIAGAAFGPSPLIGKRCIARKAEVVVDTVDSAGLPGRSNPAGISGEVGAGRALVSIERGCGRGLRGSREPGTARELPEPLMMASRLRRSSNGAPAEPGPWSMLSVRVVRGVPGDLTKKSDAGLCEDSREERPSDSGARRKTVCGTTPSFTSSIVLVDLSASVSTSTLTRDAKLE